MAPRRTKTTQDGPKRLQDDLRRPQDGCKTASRRPKTAPRRPQDGPQKTLRRPKITKMPPPRDFSSRAHGVPLSPARFLGHGPMRYPTFLLVLGSIFDGFLMEFWFFLMDKRGGGLAALRRVGYIYIYIVSMYIYIYTSATAHAREVCLRVLLSCGLVGWSL